MVVKMPPTTSAFRWSAIYLMKLDLMGVAFRTLTRYRAMGLWDVMRPHPTPLPMSYL